MSKPKDSELVVHTDAEYRKVEAGAGLGRRSREVGLGLHRRKEIFAFHREVVCEGVFDAGADYAAIMKVSLRTEVPEAVVERAFHVDAGVAARHEEQGPIPRVTQASALGHHKLRSQLVVSDSARETKREVRTPDIRPVDIAFVTDHELAHLVIVADGAADEAAVDIVAEAVVIRVGESPTAVHADVEPGPAEGRRRKIGRGRRPLGGGQIGGKGARRDARHQYAQQNSSHGKLRIRAKQRENALAPLTSLAYRKESPESLLPVDHKHVARCGENQTTMGK